MSDQWDSGGVTEDAWDSATNPGVTWNTVVRTGTGGTTGPGGGAVDSVNGQTGTVVLDAGDVGALPDDTVIPDISGLQATSEKNQPNGYAGLDGDGTIPDNRIPSSIARDTEIGTQISAHNASGTAHADIRALIGTGGSSLSDFYAANPSTAPSLPGIEYVGNATVTEAAGRVVGNVIVFDADAVVTSAHISVTTLGAGVARLGLFEVITRSATSFTAMARVIDFGTVSVSTTGQKTATLGSPASVPAGTYFLGYTSDVAPVLGAVTGTNMRFGAFRGGVVSNNWRSTGYWRRTDVTTEAVGGWSSTLNVDAGPVSTGPGVYPVLLTWARA